VRPAIDTLFRSAADELGAAVVAVVLSGTLDDGTQGLRAVKAGGGTTVAQDPDDALFPSMPASAVRFAHPDHVVTVADLPGLLDDLARQLVRGGGAEQDGDMEEQERSAEIGRRVEEEEEGGELDASARGQEGDVTELSCPDCGGTLWETGDVFPRFHCRVGHAFSPESLLVGQSSALEEAMWAAVVALEERADLADRMARRADKGHRHTMAARYWRQGSDARQRADVVRSAIPPPEADLEGELGTPS
jgi:two-component system chemotaxis response regulator CheB